jgi:Ca2+-binding RTX toxin-like protein
MTVGATIVAPGAAQADTFQVTNLLDDGSPGTLRSAINDAEANAGFDRVLFESGLTGTIALTDLEGDMDIEDTVEIVGPGHARVTIDGGGNYRIFDIEQPGGPLPGFFTKVTITGLTLTGGATGEGGAIRSFGGDLTIADSVITGNEAFNEGGAISAKYGDVLIEDSVVSGNLAEDGGAISHKYTSDLIIHDSTIADNTVTGGLGGAIFVGGGYQSPGVSNVTISGSTLSGNAADEEGGGGAIAALGTHTLVANSTISGNSAEGGGGILAYSYDRELEEEYYIGSKFTARNSTIAQNSATDEGGGLIADGDTPLFAVNTIIADNTAPVGPNVFGEIDAAFTLVDDVAGGTINETTPGSNRVAEPLLGPLASNGGPTQTHALLSGSPALDGGDATGSNRDQRAQARPVELPGVPNSTAPGADGADIGAYEAQAPPPVAAAYCRGELATIVATPGVPTEGTEGGDVIVGTKGPDVINGRGGGDLLCGWDGNDRITGGDANDTIVGQLGVDNISGDAGRDRLGGGAGNDTAAGGSGRDGLIGGPNNDTLRGGGGIDRIFGKAGNDTMFGDAAPDRLRGGPGADRFNGGPGVNALFLIRGDGDTLFGNNADSRIILRGRPARKLPPS